MAELLIRVTDRISGDTDEAFTSTKRGDVIVVCPDGWNWGTEELTAPFWRIIKLPGVLVEDLQHLANQDQMVEFSLDVFPARKSAIDLDAPDVDPATRQFMDDGGRAQPFIEVSRSWVDGHAKDRPIRRSLRVIG